MEVFHYIFQAFNIHTKKQFNKGYRTLQKLELWAFKKKSSGKSTEPSKVKCGTLNNFSKMLRAFYTRKKILLKLKIFFFNLISLIRSKNTFGKNKESSEKMT